jgi:hypothetical protein
VEEIAIIRGTSIIEFACLGQDGTLETQFVKKVTASPFYDYHQVHHVRSRWS